MKNNNKFLKSISFFAFVFALIPLSAHATNSSGFDTPPNVLTLPIAVEGQTALTINADTSGANPPKPTIVYSGPLTEGPVTDVSGNVTGYATTINTDGSLVLGTNSTTPSTATVLTITGNIASTLNVSPTGDNNAFGGIVLHADKTSALPGYPTAAGMLL